MKPSRFFLLLIVGVLFVQYVLHVLLVPNVHLDENGNARPPPLQTRSEYLTAPPLEELQKQSNLDTTVVTAYYSMHSKRPSSEYKKFMQLFLSIKTMPLVVFTDDDGAALIEQYRNHRNVTFSAASSVVVDTDDARKRSNMKNKDDPLIRVIRRPFHSWPKMQPPMMARWRKAWELDKKEKSHHSPELYAVWAAKPDFVLEAVKLDPFKSKFFVWCDIGIMRFQSEMYVYQNFPHYAPQILAARRMHFLEVGHIEPRFVLQWTRKEKIIKQPWPDYALGGGCIAGDAFAWRDFGRAYDRALLDMERRGLFIGKDQSVFFAMLIERRTAYPYRLFHAPVDMNGVVAPWMSFPSLLGGAIAVSLDERFE